MSSLTLEDIDSVSEVDRDTIAPLQVQPWNHTNYNPYGPTYVPPPPAPMPNYAPMPNKACYPQHPPGTQPGGPQHNYDTCSYVSMPIANGSVLSYQSGSG